VATGDPQLPLGLKLALFWSGMFIVIADKDALKSRSVRKEVALFARARRHVVPISIDGCFEEVKDRFPWRLISGADPEAESLMALASAQPSTEVRTRIETSAKVTRHSRRLQSAAGWTLAGVLVATSISALAIRQRVDAVKARDIALKQKEEFEKQAGEQQRRAEEMSRLADQQKKIADEQSKIAQAEALVNRARPMSDPDENGGPNTTRGLLAVQAWRTAPIAPAMAVLSAVLRKLSVPIRFWRLKKGWASVIAVDSAGRSFAFSNGKSIEIWNREGRIQRAPVEYGETIIDISFSHKNEELTVASAGHFRRIRIADWHVLDERELRGDVKFGRISTGGEYLAYLDGSQVRLVSMHGGGATFSAEDFCFVGPAELWTYERSGEVFRHGMHDLSGGPFADIYLPVDSFTVKLRACSKLGWVADEDNAVQLSNSKDVKPIPWTGDSVALADGAARLLVARDTLGGSQLWALPVGKQGWTLYSHVPSAGSAAFSGRSEVVTVDEDGEVYLSDTSDARLLWDSTLRTIPKGILNEFDGKWQTIESHEPLVEALLGVPTAHNSADAAWRIDQNGDAVSLTHIASGAPVLEIEAQGATSAAFSSDSRSVALRSGTGTRIWSLDGEYYAREVCRRLWEFATTSAPSEWHPDQYNAVCSSYYKAN
jgi:hypothetical protein